MVQHKTFNEILIESVDEVLAAIGGSVRCAIYFYLEKNLGVSKGQIPYRIDELMDTLENIFGVGARHIELQLIKQLQAKTGINYLSSLQESSLQDCVITVREEYTSTLLSEK